MNPDWTALAKPQAEMLGDVRSCANCMHMRPDPLIGGAQWWQCTRFGGWTCRECISATGGCTVDLKYWAPRPPKPKRWWERVFGP
jgi:hypothetical protein